MPDHDLVIVGGGPAGCSAAVYAARSRISTLLVTEDFGGQLLLTDSVENYLGFPHESGTGLSERYEEHVKDYEDHVQVARETVEQIETREEGFVVETGAGEHTARAVIVATGTTAKRLNVPGEEAFRNKGVHYCSVCDGPLYGGETLAVIGGGYSGTEGALFLADIAEKVYLLNYGDELSGEAITLEQIPEQDTIEVIHNADTQEFFGSTNSENSLDRANASSSPSDEMLEGLRYVDRETSEEHTLEVAGAFIEIGRIPNNDFIPSDVETDEDGHILTDDNGRTSVPGFFAAGDVSDIAEEQAILAAGEGCAAALQVGRYLKEQDST